MGLGAYATGTTLCVTLLVPSAIGWLICHVVLGAYIKIYSIFRGQYQIKTVSKSGLGISDRLITSKLTIGFACVCAFTTVIHISPP